MSIYAILHNELEYLHFHLEHYDCTTKGSDFDKFCTPNMLYHELELRI